ncbi:hypothetical protein [Pseudoduganella albidiflava]|uniref:DUF885 family protein n=1 Tax=Pseudoduganella albidiflava TaxID=321983 RepID=A0A411X4K0_9BURK|nr:hypothetical protein [Pseudoduganella albidiflava]QBI03775.1 hypothetical protein EYF70_25360 [Pseudoduganella albidiflava]GGY61723.1 hypothetical protein GCM10007387_50370 [Pseudoduganella albidiflava]
MKKLVAGGLAMMIAGGALAASVQEVAERYRKLVLAVGQHDASYVDAYYGPPALQAQAEKEKRSLAAIRKDAQAAAGDLAGKKAANPDEALRLAFLRKQLKALGTRVEMLEGKKFGFDEETALLYDAVTPHHDRAYYEALLRQIDALVPGEGPLPQRVQAFRARFAIPKDKLKPVFDAAIAACRERTAPHLALPKNESFVMEFVTGKPWSGYNWYKGDAHSLIQINTEFPIYIERAVDLGCHEGYPGHHAYNALLEQHLVKERNWVEFSVYPLYSPMSLIAEGSANYGIEMAFPDEERLAFERDVLYPLAGLDPALAGQYAALQKLLAKLSYADNDNAMHYLAGHFTREQAIEWLVNVALYPPEKAGQRVQFYDALRGYVINYNLGRDLVKAWVEKQVTATDPQQARAQRWAAFKRLLSSPMLASDLK